MAAPTTAVKLIHFCCLSALVALGLGLKPSSKDSNRTFTVDYDKGTFLKDGKPFRYISGSIHYHRVPPQLWRDRLRKMAAAGLDAIQTYIPWNYHEQNPQEYIFEGGADIVKFLKTAQEEGLYVLLRPGPYICAEEEFGGLPWWLLANKLNVTVRTSKDKVYMAAVERWFKVLLPMLEPLHYSNDGPILMMQIENEYGSYAACDAAYLQQLATWVARPGLQLYTTDGASVGLLKCGHVPAAYPTVDFGPGANLTQTFGAQKQYNNGGPLVNSEYYAGWLDHWGQKHAVVSTSSVTSGLDAMLALGANVNIYMFHGGTSFGYWNGANSNGDGTNYQPQPTSYDYDAPINEAGDLTEKYKAIRNVISKYKKLPDIPLPPNSTKQAYGEVKLSQVGDLFELLNKVTKQLEVWQTPFSMEQLWQGYGFTLYETQLIQDYSSATLDGRNILDRAGVYLDHFPIGTLYREGNVMMNVTARKGQVLSFFVENMGRINYGSGLNKNRKGIVGNVTLGGDVLLKWAMYSINISRPLDGASVQSGDDNPATPAFWRGTFNVDTPADTFLRMDQWSKGVALINGINIGRYWPAKGPQYGLYVPAAYLKPGENTVMLFEIDLAPNMCFKEKTAASSDRFANNIGSNPRDFSKPIEDKNKRYISEKLPTWRGNDDDDNDVKEAVRKMEDPDFLCQVVFTSVPDVNGPVH